MTEITSFIIDDTDLTAASSTRNFKIVGDAGANAKLYIRNEDPKYYNFTTGVFQTKFTPDTILNVKIPTNGIYISKVNIPTVTDDDQYDFHLYRDTLSSTIFSKDLSINNNFYEKSIKQRANIVLTLQVFPSTTVEDSFTTMPDNVTLTKPPLAQGPFYMDLNWLLTATDSTDGGGIEITRSPVQNDFFVTPTSTTIGAGSSSTVMYLNDVTKLVKGMSLTTIAAGSISGSPIIKSINSTAKSVTLSVAQTWGDNRLITFTGNGVNAIALSSGANVTFLNPKAELTPFTTTVVSAGVSSSQNINLDESYGVRVGAKVTGIGINNTTEQFVTSVVYASNRAVVTSAQTLDGGTILTFTGCGKTARVRSQVKVDRMPRESTTIKLTLDNILTSALT
jgi:hypothetical protein